METISRLSKKGRGVSIITCTKRAAYIQKLFRNYHSQRWKHKELIIIINKDSIPIANYRKLAKGFKNVSVFKLPESTTLGTCLNFAVKISKYNYVAKFDDDDYYGPHYLTDCMGIFKRTNASIVGKRAHFMYLSGSKTLFLRFYNSENRYVSILPGATLVIKREVFRKVKFADVNIGEDEQFCIDSRAKGFKIFSGSRHNFAAIRRKYSRDHTWIINEDRLLADRAKIYPPMKNIKAFISWPRI